MQVSLTLTLPFTSFILRHDYGDCIIEKNFGGTVFRLLSAEYDKESAHTEIRIEWTQATSEETIIDDAFKKRMVEKGVDFINLVIYHARTFDLDTTNMVLVSPRTVKSVLLKIDSDGQYLPLSAEPPAFFKDYFDYLNEPGSTDFFYEGFGESELDNVQLLEINLLADAYYAIYESRYNEAVINCLTALEAHMSPRLIKWLTNKLHNKNEKKAEDILIDMSSASKLELLFGSVEAEYLSNETKLLEDLKSANKLRNEIIHKGRRATKKEANYCLNTISRLVMIVHFKMEE